MVARIGSIARGQFYCGWIIVAVGFIIQFTVNSFQSYLTQVFFKPMSADLGWSRAVFSGRIYDSFLSYQLAFALFSATSAVGALLVYVARPPKKTPEVKRAPAFV